MLRLKYLPVLPGWLKMLDFFFSDYFSLKSGSRPSSPGPSPTPSVAGSVTSSSGSAQQRRPLISPARLNINGQRLRLFSSEPQLPTPPLSPFPLHVEPASSVYSGCFSHDAFPLHCQNGKKSERGLLLTAKLTSCWFGICFGKHRCIYL